MVDESDLIRELFSIKNVLKYSVKPKVQRSTRLEDELEKALEREIATKISESDNLEKILVEVEITRKIDEAREGIFGEKKDEKKLEEEDIISFDYQENEKEERLKIKTNDYSLELVHERSGDEDPYQINIHYERKNGTETYKAKVERDYPNERIQVMEDFTNRAEKTLHILPKGYMGGVLGFTYLGENMMARRDDLFGDMALMVDVHESIHTPDEYETRVLTDWILSRERPRYKK